MGLINNITLPNGVTLEYWRIVSLTTVVNQQSIVEIAGYISKERRDDEKDALEEARETGVYPQSNVFIETVYVNFDYDPDMSVTRAYELLKASEEFEGAQDVFEDWAADTQYYVEDVVIYNGQKYRCIQTHVSQVGWEPSATPAIWREAVDPGVIPEWKQPTGAHDAYALGDHVLYSGKEWVSIVDGNVWEPGVYGWEEV